MSTPECTEEKIEDAIANKWVPYFAKIEQQLEKNGYPVLVGKSMTLADIAVGSYVMRFVHNPAVTSGPKFKAALEQFPKVTKWSDMIGMCFKEWMATQPPRPF